MVRPWLQDFTLGSPAYGVDQVKAQIKAVEDQGFNEWILWNAGVKYTKGRSSPRSGPARSLGQGCRREPPPVERLGVSTDDRRHHPLLQYVQIPPRVILRRGITLRVAKLIAMNGSSSSTPKSGGLCNDLSSAPPRGGQVRHQAHERLGGAVGPKAPRASASPPAAGARA